jgi:Flp pilus assembly protein TadD
MVALVIMAAATLSYGIERQVKREQGGDGSSPQAEAPSNGTTLGRALSAPFAVRLPPRSKWELLFAGGAVVLIAALSFSSYARARVFATDERLWRDTLAKNPAAWPAHNNLGCILAERQDLAGAVSHFEASLRLYPENSQAHANFGKALLLQGKGREAEAQFVTAVELSPRNAEAQHLFGSALAAQGRHAEALPHFRAAVEADPAVETRLEYAALLYQAGNLREAALQYRQALARKADDPEALSNAALILATAADPGTRDGRQAVQFAEHACRLTSYREPRMLGTLAAAYAESGDFANAVVMAGKAADLATAAGDRAFAALNQRLLKYYRAGKPWHEAPRPNPDTSRPPRSASQ